MTERELAMLRELLCDPKIVEDAGLSEKERRFLLTLDEQYQGRKLSYAQHLWLERIWNSVFR